MKRNSKAQWMNLQWNSNFVNWTRFPLLCEKSGAILLVLVGLTAVQQAGWQSDEILVDFQIFKSTDRSGRFFTELTKVQFCYSVTNRFQSVFS